MATESQITELSIFVSTDMKVNVGNYESVGVAASRSERWDVAGLTLEEVDALYAERYEAIKTEVGNIAAARYEAAQNRDV